MARPAATKPPRSASVRQAPALAARLQTRVRTRCAAAVARAARVDAPAALSSLLCAMSDITKGIKIHRARVAGPKAGALEYSRRRMRGLCRCADRTAWRAEKKKLAGKKKKGISTEKSNPKARPQAAARQQA